MNAACQIISESNALLADDAAGDVANGVRRSALADARDPGVGVDEDHHVALREGLRTVAIVIRRIEETDARHLCRRQATGMRAAAAAAGACADAERGPD